MTLSDLRRYRDDRVAHALPKWVRDLQTHFSVCSFGSQLLVLEGSTPAASQDSESSRAGSSEAEKRLREFSPHDWALLAWSPQVPS